MLTDMILEEEFEKNGESWYNQQELEHGKSRSALRSHPNSVSVWAGCVTPVLCFILNE